MKRMKSLTTYVYILKHNTREYNMLIYIRYWMVTKSLE